MDTRHTTFVKLPPEILTQVGESSDLDTSSLINLSLSNKYLHGLFKPTLFQHLKKFIARSAKKQVEVILKTHPDFASSPLSDICQIALGFGDIDMVNVIMQERKEILKQIKLPKNLVDESYTYDFSAVVAAIESGKNVEEEFIQLRTNLDKLVKKGFTYQALLDAYELYDKKYDLWNVEQHKLFSVKVIGYLQRLAPAWLKKALAAGIRKSEKQETVSKDTFTLQSGESIDPAKDEPGLGLGFDFCINSYGNRAPRSNGPMPGLLGRADKQWIDKLFNAKKAELEKLVRRKQIIDKHNNDNFFNAKKAKFKKLVSKWVSQKSINV